MHKHLVITALLFLGASARLLPDSFLISVPDRRDHVWDPHRGLLYISTSSGWIERFSLLDMDFLSPWLVGVSLNGIDITTDGQAIYVAEGAQGATQGFLRKVDPSSGAVTNIPYDLDFGEAGAWDVAIANNGKGILTTRYSGSGWVPLRELVLATDTLLIRSDAPGSGSGGEVRQDTLIGHGFDRSLFFFTESNISSGPIFTYDADLDSFPSSDATGGFLGNSLSTVNADGSLIALEFADSISILDPNLATVEILAADSGVEFAPNADILYAGDASTDEITAFDTGTWQALRSYPLGEDLAASRAFDDGVLSITHDGSHLFVSTAAGIRGIPLLQIFADGFESGDTSAWSSATP